MGDAIVLAIEKLGGFLAHQINIRAGVKDNIRSLKDELCYLQSSVRAAEAMEETDQILPWINNVKDVANDALIILEKFSIHQDEEVHLGTSEHGTLDRKFRSLIGKFKKQANLYDIGKEIKSLKERVVEIKKRRKEYGIGDILANPKVLQHKKKTIPRATSFENHVDVVGFEDEFDTLLDEIVKDDPSLSVISIHGMGGLGKSTLASKLYHSNELSYFQCRAWVCVSKDYNIKDVLQRLLKSFMKAEVNVDLSKMDEVDMLRHLRKFLLDSTDSYLVVIDDIWEISAWDKIKKAFPDKEDGSRIVITTRYEKVAQKVDDNGFVHRLRPLGEDESWELFCKRAKPTRNLEKLGEDMVSKCRGLPLAIVVLSGLLLHNKIYEHWSKVKDHIWRKLVDDSVKIVEILTLCYDDLNPQIKQCFSYIARFPEDHTFRVDKLKMLFIAEELLTEADQLEYVMEDLADEYIYDLTNRNLIQVKTFLLNGQVREFCVHDLVRDLVIQKSPKNKFLRILDFQRASPAAAQMLNGSSQPRLSVYDGSTGQYFELLGLTSDDDFKLRSLALLNGSDILKMEEVKLMYTRFIYLKVLDMTGVASDNIPEEIGDLVLLKFLGLMHGYIKSDTLVIPPTVGKLKKLQTLCGSDCQYEFPRELCKLKELRHLIFGHYQLTNSHIKIGSQQTKLQSLETIWYEDWIQIDTIVNFTNLQYLALQHASFEEVVECSFDSVAMLPNLQRFFFDSFPDFIPTIKPLSSCKYLKRVYFKGAIEDPQDLNYLPNSVTDLTLSGSELTKDPMPTLGSLPNLTSLVLVSGVYTGEKMVCDHDAFPSLQYLILDELLNLEEWQVEEGSLPFLEGLDIDNCENLKIIPERMKCFPPIPQSIRWNWD